MPKVAQSNDCHRFNFSRSAAMENGWLPMCTALDNPAYVPIKASMIHGMPRDINAEPMARTLYPSGPPFTDACFDSAILELYGIPQDMNDLGFVNEPRPDIRFNDDGCLAKARRRPKNRNASIVLGQNLTELEKHNPATVIYVRGVKKLFDSERILRQHFSQYGKVQNVYFSNGTSKEKGLERRRIRPSDMAFILMSSVEAAAEAILAGEEQIVGGVQIYVRKFVSKDERHSVYPKQAKAQAAVDVKEKESDGTISTASSDEHIPDEALGA